MLLMANSDSKIAKNILKGKSKRLRGKIELQISYHPGNSPAIVFIHGGLGNRLNWRSQYEYFVRQGREVLAYDLAGHGESSPYPKYSMGRHRRDLTRLLKSYKIKTPILCCHSYGVPLGLEWARRHNTTALVLIAGGTHDLAPWWEIPLIKFLAWGGRYLYCLPGIQKLTNRLSSDRLNEQITQFFVESPVPLKAEPYKALEIFWGYNFWNRGNSERRQSDRHFRRLTIPILVISGGNDPTFTKKMGDELTASLKDATHVHLPEAGHLLLAEYPERVNQIITDFVSG